jgi:predicted site-specific integrase-resolvase
MSANVTQLLTLEEIHKLTGASLETLRRYCRTGKLKATKFALKWYVREEDYNTFFTPDNPTPDKREG